MKRFASMCVACLGGYIIFLQIQKNMQRQATWQQVTDPVDF
ncbi:hypothetical protein [Trueperella pyogenes]|nr:hypothetical protein [Trueperella pyogenes]AJC70348.1 hypothetical protein X956_00035 [Trueperella pyogenes TP8]WHU57666.1 hypothetical protein QEV10_02940 [Trueperella pyogenes]WHU60486.1 hypothetical protein QEV13_07465 [Trueperella pyogenes]SUO88281.1 Uncharacterised protein [Trueperella pyogenes]